MNILIIAGSISLWGEAARADHPIEAHISIYNSTIKHQGDMTISTTNNCDTDFGQVSVFDSTVKLSLASGKAPIADNGNRQFDPGILCSTRQSFKQPDLNPSTPVVVLENSVQAQVFAGLASTKGVQIAVNNECAEKNPNCAKTTKLHDGSNSSVMTYSMDQVTVTLPGSEKPKTLTQYFLENGPTKKALNDFNHFTGNRSPSVDADQADATVKHGYGPQTAGLMVSPILSDSSSNPISHL